jgi:hypothetical protein
MPGSKKKSTYNSTKKSVVSLPEISHGTRRTRDSYENSSHETEDRLYANIKETMHTPYELGFYKIPNFEMLVILSCLFGAMF